MAASRKMAATVDAAYEAARSANIARNQEYLHALGLAEAAAAVRPAPSPVVKRLRLLPPFEAPPRKQSRRLRGEAAPPLFAVRLHRARVWGVTPRDAPLTLPRPSWTWTVQSYRHARA
jgi:hypothetical protein